MKWNSASQVPTKICQNADYYIVHGLRSKIIIMVPDSQTDSTWNALTETTPSQFKPIIVKSQYKIVSLYGIKIYKVLLCLSTISATTEGSARVVTSPRSSVSLDDILHNILRIILPERVLGSPVVIYKALLILLRQYN